MTTTTNRDTALKLRALADLVEVKNAKHQPGFGILLPGEQVLTLEEIRAAAAALYNTQENTR